MIGIVVKFDLEGSHAWPDAPDEFKELRSRHSHIFRFECVIPVSQANRGLEFLKVRRELRDSVRSSFKGEPCDFRSNSCEMMAEHVARTIKAKYGVDASRVRVCEDVFVGGEWTNDRS